MSKVRPILMNSEMVQATLEESKTQTRRIVKPSPGQQSKWASIESIAKCPDFYLCEVNDNLGAQFQHPKAGVIHNGINNNINSPYGWVKSPFGKVGDLLYIRETIQHPGYEGAKHFVYTADGKPSNSNCVIFNKRHVIPSIHMPRWASRLTLEITDIRVERLQDISDEDALAEGISEQYGVVDVKCYGGSPVEINGYVYSHANSDSFECPIEAFADLWQSINGKESWDSNPWVWVIEFKVHKVNVDDFLKGKKYTHCLDCGVKLKPTRDSVRRGECLDCFKERKDLHE